MNSKYEWHVLEKTPQLRVDKKSVARPLYTHIHEFKTAEEAADKLNELWDRGMDGELLPVVQ